MKNWNIRIFSKFVCWKISMVLDHGLRIPWNGEHIMYLTFRHNQRLYWYIHAYIIQNVFILISIFFSNSIDIQKIIKYIYEDAHRLSEIVQISFKDLFIYLFFLM
jgi:hypothetical protein